MTQQFVPSCIVQAIVERDRLVMQSRASQAEHAVCRQSCADFGRDMLEHEAAHGRRKKPERSAGREVHA